MKFDQAIGTHQPDELRLRKASAEETQSRGGKGGREMFLKIGDHNAIVARNVACLGGSLCQGSAVRRSLQGISRRHKPPDATEPQALHCNTADQEMRRMRWVEGATEQADALAG
jgi:hypothetical protein